MTDRNDRRVAGRGFTLVEVLVAVAITSLLSLAIYSLFDTTSNALYQADSMADGLDSSRFALERVKADIRNAGAFATPDSANDPWVRPTPSDRRVAGLVPYGGGNGWQDYAGSVMPSEIQSANTAAVSGKSQNLQPNFDGIVVMGAYDFPVTFEVASVTDTKGVVYANTRGLYKLRRNDLFNVSSKPGYLDFSKDRSVKPIVTNDGSRILRIMDRSGYLQFIGIDTAQRKQGGSVTPNFLRFDFDGDQSLHFREGNERYGLDPQTQESEDMAYDASMIDVFWYHVQQDPTDPTNFQLVRERLDGPEVSESLAGGFGSFNPAAADNQFDSATDSYDSGDSGEYVVVANRVADFQVWFDCAAASGDGSLKDASWNTGWNTPDGKGTCMDPTKSGSFDPGRARVAHIRLSIRTENESPDVEHNPFPTLGKSGDDYTMETFDINPDFQGATRVYTTQVDFEIPNYAVRNIK
jgi:prepilin-type N-terminal cleavage/methylation domain-containing protein